MKIDYLTGLYNFAKPPKKKVTVKNKKTILSRERQDIVLSLIQDKPLHVAVIAKLVGVSYEVARLDVRSLLVRGKANNHAVGKNTYYVKAA